MNTRPYCLLLLTVFMGLAGCANTPPHTASHSQPDPWSGTYTVFEQYGNGFLESTRYGGSIALEKTGAVYRTTIDRDSNSKLTLALLHNQLRPAPEHQRSFVIGKTADAQADILQMQDGFLTAYLTPGVGPASWTNESWHDADGTLQHRTAVRKPSTAYACLIGQMTFRDQPVHAELGSILITPNGKYMYFGDPYANPADTRNWRSHRGWLDTAMFGRALFHDDGSLTQVGRAYRLALKAEQQDLRRAFETRHRLKNIVTQAQIDRFIASIQPGMPIDMVYILIEEHFNILDHIDEQRGEDTYRETFSVRHAGVTIQMHFVQDPAYTFPRFIVPTDDSAADAIKVTRDNKE